MATLRKYWQAMMYGFSTFSIFPEEIEVKGMSEEEIHAEAWRVTGENLRNAINKVGREYGQNEC